MVVSNVLKNDYITTTNLGSGEEISIKRMIETVSKVSGKEIKINWDTSKPNGDMRRKMSTNIQEQVRIITKTWIRRRNTNKNKIQIL